MELVNGECGNPATGDTLHKICIFSLSAQVKPRKDHGTSLKGHVYITYFFKSVSFCLAQTGHELAIAQASLIIPHPCSIRSSSCLLLMCTEPLQRLFSLCSRDKTTMTTMRVRFHLPCFTDDEVRRSLKGRKIGGFGQFPTLSFTQPAGQPIKTEKALLRSIQSGPGQPRSWHQDLF